MGQFIDVTMRLIDEFTSPLNKAVDNMKKNADKTIGAGKQIETAGESISKVGSSLTKTITTPILGISTAIVKVASDFEEEMAKVKAISQASGDDFKNLRELAIDLGASTSFSASEVAQGMTEMAKAGWATSDIMAGMGGVLDAAAASGESLATTSTIVADALTGFGLDAGESGRVADLLTQAANAGTIDIADLGETFKYISPVANAMNSSIEDVTTAVSAMSTAGIKGSQAGTSLRTLLTNLINPTDKMQVAMEKLGIEISKDGKFKSLNDIVGNLRDGFSGLEDDEKSYYASILAGKEGMSGMLSLLNLTEDQYNDISDTMYNAAGVAKETADVMRDNLNSRIEELGGSLETLAIKFGDILIPKVQEAVEWLTELVDKFTGLDDGTRETIVKFATIAAAVGPIIFVFGKVVKTVGTFVKIFGTIGKVIGNAGGIMALITSPAGIVIGVLAAIVVAGILVYKNWDKIKEYGKKAWGFIQDIAANCGIDFDGLKDKAIGLGDKAVEAWNKIKDGLSMMWEAVEPLVLQLAGFFMAILPAAFGGAMGFFSNMVDSMMNMAGYLMGGFAALIDFIANIFCGKWKDAFNSLQDFMGNFGALILEVLKAPINGLISMINGVFSTLNNLGLTIPDWVPEFGGKTFGFNLPTIPKLYTGTDDWQGGPAMVHDRGAEIIDLPTGSRVYPHDKSLQMARAEGAAQASGANINIAKLADSIIVREDADIDRIATALVDKLQRIAENTGGVPIGNLA